MFISPLVDGLVALLMTVIFTAILARNSGLLHSKTHISNRVVDAALAGVNVIVSLSIVVALDSRLPFRCFDGKMLSSAVVFMGNPKPPSPKAFVVCSACGFVVGLVLNLCDCVRLFGKVNTQVIALGLLLFFWRISGTSFSATVGLATFLAQNGPAGGAGIRYLVTPWLVGHSILFALAHLLERVRSTIRVYLAKQRFMRSQSASDLGLTRDERRAQLWAKFDSIDSSHDRRIDATEFKVAMRSLIGTDLPLDDCEAIIRSVDADGNGSIDFDEFCSAIEGDMLQHHKKNL